VAGQVIDLDARGDKDLAEPVGALDVAAGGEGVHALDVKAVGDPALAAQQDSHGGVLHFVCA